MSQPQTQSQYRRVDPSGWAAFARHPPVFDVDRRQKGARGRGLRFQKAAVEWLESLYPKRFIPGPWLMYAVPGRAQVQWCQPDGLLYSPRRGIVYILEIKLKHTDGAWWQLHELYAPVIERIHPRNLWEIRLVEIVKWYDPSTYFPGRHYLRRRPHLTAKGEVGVVIWKA